MPPTVKDNPDASRYEVFLDDELAGHAEYRRTPGRLTLTHTVIDDDLEGQGIGSTLARGVLDAAREEGREVLPFCEFMAEYIRRHPDDYLDLVPEERRGEFDLV
ncbi:MAG: GNAT family N-acetyltransferase [Nocardioides sp.]